MAGNNQIQFLRGNKDKVSEAKSDLLPGQPLFSKEENYLYVGRDADSTDPVDPVTTDRIEKEDAYLQIEGNNITASSSNFNIQCENIYKVTTKNKSEIRIEENSTAYGNLKADIHLIAKKSGYINLQGDVYVTPSSVGGTETSLSAPTVTSNLIKGYADSTAIEEGYPIPSISLPVNSTYTAPTILIGGNIIPETKYSLGDSSHTFYSIDVDIIKAGTIIQCNQDIYADDVYTYVNGEAKSINDRLDKLGFKEGTISDFSGSNSSLTKLGNYVIGSMTFAPGKAKIGTIPIGFRPYAKRETKIVVGHYDIIESVNKYHPGTLTFNTDGTIVCSRYEWDSESTTVIFGWDTTSGDYS